MTLFTLQVSEGGETGGARRFSFRNISARLRGGDTSLEGQLATAEKELQDAEDAVERTQKEFE